jgi:hypothetical protein
METGLRARSAVGVILIVLVALLAIPAAMTLVWPHHPPKLTEDSLARSVRDDTAWSEAGCVHLGGTHWRCNVSSASDGGGVYDIRMTSGHCWSATAIEQHGSFRQVSASGCL